MPNRNMAITNPLRRLSHSFETRVVGRSAIRAPPKRVNDDGRPSATTVKSAARHAATHEARNGSLPAVPASWQYFWNPSDRIAGLHLLARVQVGAPAISAPERPYPIPDR